MPLSRYRLPVFLVFLLFISFRSAAQTDATSVYNDGVINMVNTFDVQVGLGGRLFNGYIYKGYESTMQGSPFLDNQESFSRGVVEYDGETFSNVPLKYDIYADQLIAQFGDDAPIQLVKDKIKSFDLLHRHFIQITNGKVKNGFYHELYGGKSQIINKIEKQTEANKSLRIFMPVHDYQQYYILKNGSYIPVNSLGDVLDVFADKKKELRDFIKNDNLQFNKLKEYSMAQIAQYYDRLTR